MLQIETGLVLLPIRRTEIHAALVSYTNFSGGKVYAGSRAGGTLQTMRCAHRRQGRHWRFVECKFALENLNILRHATRCGDNAP